MQEVTEKNRNRRNAGAKYSGFAILQCFHISQVENILPLDDSENRFDTEPIEEAEKVFRDYAEREHIALHIGDGNKAFYRPFDDSITLPSMAQFERAEEFYSTAFHECGHSTMKATRCDREAENKGSHFGNEGYSKEELVAEITSSAIVHSLGLETEDTFKNKLCIHSKIGCRF